MLKHHEDSLKIMCDYFREQPGVIALIFHGSVAKGKERPDSDLDAIVILTDEQWEKQRAEHRLAEAITGKCTYPEGYFDVKYKTVNDLIAVAERGSEPTQATYIGSRVMFSDDPRVPELVEKIAVFDRGAREKKMLTFYSNMLFNKGYFMGCLREDDCYMKYHVISELIYSVYRMILQENEVLFSCNRRLEQQVADCPNKPENIIDMARAMTENFSQESVNAFCDCYMNWTKYPHCTDWGVIHTHYVDMYEEWWKLGGAKFINEW